MKLRQYYVYILMNAENSTTYIGVANDLEKRYAQHRNKVVSSFSSKYNLSKLVYFEICDTAEQAIAREKQLKNWHREWKLNLIKQLNPDFRDLALDYFQIPKQVRNDAPRGMK